MLQIVPLPVHERDSAPSPKYSTIAPVPPFTVKIPATFRITSFGATHPDNLPVNLTPISLGNLSSHGKPAMTSHASAPPTPIAPYLTPQHSPFANPYQTSFQQGKQSSPT